jgi:hypothetical protein
MRMLSVSIFLFFLLQLELLEQMMDKVMLLSAQKNCKWKTLEQMVVKVMLSTPQEPN